MPSRKRSRPTLRERGMKPPHKHFYRDDADYRYDEVECGWCEHEKWEKFRRAMQIHDMSFNRYIIQEEPW